LKDRAGVYVKQPLGYKAFIPKPLPPRPPIKIGQDLQNLLSQADRTIARLDGVTFILPNPDLFVAMYVKKEALLSSQIEGTQASLVGVLEFEANIKPKEDINEIKEVVNYISAMNYGLKRLKTLPLSTRLIKEIHLELLKEVRGAERSPGEYRRSQNWIGPPGCTLSEATFVPPPPHEVPKAMSDLEKFIYKNDNIPPLIKAGLIHTQFETIHPFLDGNGRIGRLLITFYLCWKGILSKPLLYLSYYLKKHRQEYYEKLMDVRLKGDWEGWLKFFLKGVIEVSIQSTETARKIISLRESLIEKLYQANVGSPHAVILLNKLFERPIIDIVKVRELLGISHQAASELVKRFDKLGILREITGKKRYKKYIFQDYLNIIEEGTKP